MFYITLTTFLSLGYVFWMLRYKKDWASLPNWSLPNNHKPQTKVSILVPARNESSNIQRCIESLIQQKYPESLYEILVLDDHSEDDTAALAEAFDDSRIRVLRLADYPNLSQQAHKKGALTIGVKEAKGDLIITTDADCFASPRWLSLLVSFYEKEKPKMIAAPVNMVGEQNLLERFQSLDFCGMMGITGAGIWKDYLLMGNGANIAYEKTVFEEVGGFEGIDHLASGDDMLLMQKIAKIYPQGIAFLKSSDAVVYTGAQPTWSAFFQQRIRWASKSGAYPQWGVTLQLGIVYLFCCTIVLNLLLLPFWKLAWAVLIIQLLLKMFVDYLLLSEMSAFFGRKDLMKSFLSAQFLHIGYIVAVGTLGNLVKEYKWKGRTVK